MALFSKATFRKNNQPRARKGVVQMVQGIIRSERLLQAYLLFMAVVLVPVALCYGINPAGVLPRFLDIKVEGVDQTHIFRAQMWLFLGASTFWAVAAFKPDCSSWRQSGRSSFASRSPLGG